MASKDIKYTITVDEKGAIKSINQVEGTVRKSTKSMEKNFLSLGKVISGVVVAGAIYKLGESFINAARTTENLTKRLRILTGSVEEGNRLFADMKKLASKVPFEFEKIMGAATNLAGVFKGNVDLINQWMPLITDLAAATGMSIEDVTNQVGRMLSAGAQSADMFKERGVNAFLGFKNGVSYTVADTEKMLWDSWNRTDSKFRGATDSMKDSWDGLISMIQDKWFELGNKIMENGAYDALKEVISEINGEFGEWISNKDNWDQLGQTIKDVAISMKELVGYLAEIMKYARLRSVIGTLNEAADLESMGKLGITMSDFRKMGYLERQDWLDKRKKSLLTASASDLYMPFEETNPYLLNSKKSTDDFISNNSGDDSNNKKRKLEYIPGVKEQWQLYSSPTGLTGSLEENRYGPGVEGLKRLKDRLEKEDELREEEKRREEEYTDYIQGLYDELWGEVGSAFKDTFKDLIKGTESFEDAMLSMLDRVSDALMDLAWQMALNAAASSGTGWISTIGTALGGMKKAANGAVWEGGFQAFASGGTVSKPTLGLVGEGKYNEAIVPLPDGKSIPVQMMGGGASIVNNITVTNSQPYSEQQNKSQAKEIQRQIEMSMRKYLIDEQRPGGSLNRSTMRTM